VGDFRERYRLFPDLGNICALQVVRRHRPPLSNNLQPKGAATAPKFYRSSVTLAASAGRIAPTSSGQFGGYLNTSAMVIFAVLPLSSVIMRSLPLPLTVSVSPSTVLSLALPSPFLMSPPDQLADEARLPFGYLGRPDLVSLATPSSAHKQLRTAVKRPSQKPDRSPRGPFCAPSKATVTTAAGF
jgi:hypothetical protein